ncbi:signal peptidase I [Thalassotalea sediminis]|uniref:signal peptidase I n=1 Tax=Thalassotalea sediminis TaxID=1759089 RepID=UPI0025738AD7|nr:signal peptidase I [Thalassotalea sediminis]
MRTTIDNFWQENKKFALFLLLMLVFRSAVADWNDVPTGSMKPTIIEGDRIFINKLAYDVNLPFFQFSLIKLADPDVNDIIIFESNAAGKRLVKRVIGVPGDVVEMVDNKLIINHQAVRYRRINQSNKQEMNMYTENIIGHTHHIQTTEEHNNYGNFSPVVVPTDHYLVLGDNRNNSADSRVIGFVPRREIIGKSTHVVFSLDYEHYYLPRIDRFFASI